MKLSAGIPELHVSDPEVIEDRGVTHLRYRVRS